MGGFRGQKLKNGGNLPNVRIPVVAGFVVLCGGNIVGNIISAEKRCNYPGRSRVTRLVSYNWT